jgi:hypothetical protein
MHQRLKWLSMIIVSSWLLGCSTAPSQTTKVTPQQTAQPTAQTSAAQGVPAAEVPEKEFDFGVMAEDGSFVHEFKIANKGSAPLEIQAVIPD